MSRQDTKAYLERIEQYLTRHAIHAASEKLPVPVEIPTTIKAEVAA